MGHQKWDTNLSVLVPSEGPSQALLHLTLKAPIQVIGTQFFGARKSNLSS